MEMEEKSRKIKKLVETKKSDPKNEMFKSEEEIEGLEEEASKAEAIVKELEEKRNTLKEKHSASLKTSIQNKSSPKKDPSKSKQKDKSEKPKKTDEQN